MTDKEWLTSSCTYQGRIDICESALKNFKAEGKTLPPDEAIEICVKVIKVGNPRSTFDAYAENGQVSTFGSARDEFQFRKCMNSVGNRLVDLKP